MKHHSGVRPSDGQSKERAAGPIALAEIVATKGGHALRLLLEAHECAAEVARHTWDFAVEIRSLRKVGMTNSLLRWLVCKGHLLHADESNPQESQTRAFQVRNELAFSRRTCFVLSEQGLTFVRQALPGDASVTNLIETHPSPNGQKAATAAEPEVVEQSLPRWDSDRQELRLGKHLIKRFKLPAPNQEIILAAFEEEGWPVRIDDPIPQRRDQEPKRRLHDTIMALNRHRKKYLIRFTGDGSGQGVRWDRVPSDNSESSTNGQATQQPAE